MSRSVIRVALGIILALVLLIGAAGALVWWKISDLKQSLVQSLQKAIGAQVQISSLDLDLWKGELHAATITLTNDRPSAPWETGAISQATVHFHPADIFSKTMPITVEVSSWNVVLHPHPTATTLASGTTSTSSTSDTAPTTGLNPTFEASSHRVQVTQLTAQEGSVEIHLSDDKTISFHGVSFTANHTEAGVWTTNFRTTSIVASSLETGVTSVDIRGEQDKISFSNLRVACDQGFVTGEGEIALTGTHAAHVALKATDIPVSMLVSVEWQMKLSGMVTGNLDYAGDDSSGSAKGHLIVNQAKFNVLPFLGKVTAMVGLADISNTELDKATSDFEWKDRTLHLANIDIRKNDVTRIAGTVDIDSASQIDGKLKLGLPSSITSKWPQLQDKIFPVQSEEFNWADVHVTGTPDHLQEDLSSRLLAVGLQEGGSLLDDAKKKAADLLKSFMGN